MGTAITYKELKQLQKILTGQQICFETRPEFPEGIHEKHSTFFDQRETRSGRWDLLSSQNIYILLEAVSPTIPLIIDNRVLSTIWRETGGCNHDLKPRHNYGAATYVAALEVLTNWAEQLTSSERIVTPDELERWAFEPVTDVE